MLFLLAATWISLAMCGGHSLPETEWENCAKEAPKQESEFSMWEGLPGEKCKHYRLRWGQGLLSFSTYAAWLQTVWSSINPTADVAHSQIFHCVCDGTCFITPGNLQAGQHNVHRQISGKLLSLTQSCIHWRFWIWEKSIVSHCDPKFQLRKYLSIYPDLYIDLRGKNLTLLLYVDSCLLEGPAACILGTMQELRSGLFKQGIVQVAQT